VTVLTKIAIDYLLRLETADAYRDQVLVLWNRHEENAERLIHVARFACDASFSPKMSKKVANSAVGRILADDDRPGAGYARGLLLLALNKLGKREHREKISEWASVETLKDEQLRLHFLYVFACRGELEEKLRLALVPLVSSDIDLLLRLCSQAQQGKVKRVKKLIAITR
jgi:hypothetical protein